MRRRLLAIFLTLTMALAVFPASALAVEETGLCPHHQTHTVDCGYATPTEGTPCTHVHTAACYSDADLPADGEEKEADACTHVHDAECGYAEGSAGSPCTFVCNICPVEAMIEALPAYTDAAEEDVVDIEAAQAAYDALTEEEQAAVNPELADKLADLSDLALLLTNVQNTSDAEPLVGDGMSGNCGTDGNKSSVTWKLVKNNGDEENGTYTLTISGEGQMPDSGSNDVPWKNALSGVGETYTDKTTNGEDDKPKTFYPITKIVIEDDITSIGNNAFSYTDVSEITIPNSVTTIGSGVFTWTLQLEEIHIPASVTNLNYTGGDNGEYTYYNTFDGAFNLKNITVEKGSDNYAVVGDILIGKLQDTEDEWMIINCPDQLDTTHISADIFSDYNVTAVGRTAFSACGNLTAIDLPDSVTEIGAGAINKCYSLESFSVPDGVTEFGGNFRGCSSLQSVDWNNVTSITVADVFAPFWEDENDGEKHLCAVAETDLSKVTHIAGGAFQNSQLESVTFSTSSDLYIGARAFAECEKWEMPELDFSYGDYVAFDAFEETPAYNVIFPHAQDENAAVQLLRGQRIFSLESLEAAFDAAEDGDTILLLRDVELSATETVLAGEEITLDLNGKVLKFTGESGRPLLVYGTLNLQDSAPDATHYYTKGKTGLWTVCESGVSGANKITGGIITGGDHKQFSGGAIMVSGGTLNMSGGNIIGNQAAGAVGGIATSNGTVNISGGRVMGNVGTVGGEKKVSDLSGGGYSISGGTFTTPVDPAWCSGLLQPYDNGDGTYTVEYQGQGVARIGSTYYSTFNEAFKAAKEMSDQNVTIIVMADTKLTGVCSLNGSYTGPTITVDLNGHVLTAAEKQRLFTIQAGTLNIQDSDPNALHYYTEEDTGLWKVCESNEDGVKEIHGGIITGGNFTNSGGAIVVTTGATVNMYGGNIIGNKSTSNASASGGVNVSGGTFKMTGGTIQGNIYESGDQTGIRDVNGGTITGGTFTTDVTQFVGTGYTASETGTVSGIYVVKQEMSGEYSIVTIPDQVYTGAEIKPKVTVLASTGVLNGGYTVSYSDNTSVGTATATVQIGEATKKVTFRIIRDENATVILYDMTVTYGNEYSMEPSAMTSAGHAITDGNAIDIQYYTNPGCEEPALAEAPVDAGVYYVKATLEGTENYAETYTVATLTIQPATFSVTAESYSGTYDGQPHSITVAAEESAVVTYSRNGYDYTNENPTFTQAGTYTVYYKAKKTNHSDVTGSLTVNIQKAPLTATYTGDVVHVGETPTLYVTVTGFVNGETPDSAKDFVAPTISNAPTDVGQYTLTPTGGAAANYYYNYVSGTLVILPDNPQQLTITPDQKHLTGGGTVTLTVANATGNVAVTCDNNGIAVSGSGASWTATLPNRTETYTFTVKDSASTATCTVSVTGTDEPTPPDDTVSYKVEHYLWNGYRYVLRDTESFTGEIGDTVTAQPKDYPGYRYNERISIVSSTLIPIKDESDIVTLKLYYDERTTSRPSGGSSEPSYTVSVEDVVNGAIETDPRRAEEGEEVTITVTPDDGYELDTLTVIDRDGDEVEVTEERNGTFTFEMPDSRVTIEAIFVPVAEEPTTPAAPTDWVNPYTDVAANAWYYDAVAYVTANGLMNGTSATTFAPDATTTRAMIWTVLARMNGQSVDGGTPWYALAQSWAVRANVSDGTNPGNPISREELATMLYRAAGSPDVSGNLLSYPDGNAVSAWAENALLWATQNGIISGIDGMLTPQGQATRAQVATMLMRFREAI